MSDHGHIGYVEIPTRNLARAVEFYGALFGWAFNEDPVGSPRYSTFSGAGDRSMGALEEQDDVAPHTGGPVTYVTVDDLDTTCAQVTELGGTVERGKTEIGPDLGSYALVRDLDGNRIGLWAKD